MRTATPQLGPAIAVHGNARMIRSGRLQDVGLRALLLAAFAVSCPALPAQLAAPSQVDVQSVYLFDFAKFVRWPPGDEHQTFTLCVAGQKAYADTLKRLVQGEHIDAHPLAVRSLQTPGDESACQILFIGASAREQLEKLLAATAGKPVLTVSDVPGFLDRGGMIQFLLIGDRVRFSVNLRPVGTSGLTLSSELLKVSMTVTGRPVGGGTP